MIPGALRLHNPLSAVVWFALFVPSGFFGGWWGRLFPAAVCLLGALILFAKPSSWETRQAARRAASFFMLLELLYIVSYAYSVAFNGVRTGPRDYVELAYIPVAGLFVVYLIRHYDERVGGAVETGLAAASYACFLAAAVDAPRFSLFEDPASLGYFAAAALTYFLFFSRSPLRLAHASAALLCVLLDGGAAAWVVCALIVCAAVEAFIRRRLTRPPMRGYSLFVSAGLLMILLGGLTVRQRTAPQEAPLASAGEVLRYAKRSPLLGWGPAAYEPISSVPNQYLQSLLRQGLAGAAVLAAGLGLAAWRLLRAAWPSRTRRAGSAAFVAAVAALLSTGAFLADFRLFALTALVAARMREKSS